MLKWQLLRKRAYPVADTVSGGLVSLLRHGETAIGQAFRGSLDDVLTEFGWRQMEQSIQHLNDVDHIVSSPLKRCFQFAESLAARTNISLEVNADFREMHFGDWEGMTSAEVLETDEAGLTRFWENPFSYTPANGESLQCVVDRVIPAWQSLKESNETRHTLLVTHGGVIRVIHCYENQQPYESLMSLEVANASLHQFYAD